MTHYIRGLGGVLQPVLTTVWSYPTLLEARKREPPHQPKFGKYIVASLTMQSLHAQHWTDFSSTLTYTERRASIPVLDVGSARVCRKLSSRALRTFRSQVSRQWKKCIADCTNGQGSRALRQSSPLDGIKSRGRYVHGQISRWKASAAPDEFLP
jgi:hypothetical protein